MTHPQPTRKPIDELKRSTDTEELHREYKARLRLLGTLTSQYWQDVTRAEMAAIQARAAELIEQPAEPPPGEDQTG